MNTDSNNGLCPYAGCVSVEECELCRPLWLWYCEVDGCDGRMENPWYIPDHTTADADGIADDIYACEPCYRKWQFEVWWNGPQDKPCVACGAEWQHHIMDHHEGCALMEWVNECDEESRRIDG